MAAKKKHLSSLEDPSTASSSKGVEESQEEDQVESEAEVEAKQVESDSQDDDEEEEVSGEEEEPVQERQKKASSPEVKKKMSTSATPPTKSSQKRPAEDGGREGEVSKRAKKKKKAADQEADGGEEAAAETVEKEAAAATGERPSFFRRFWSEGDEIVILEGIVDFMEKQGPAADINANAEAFHKSIKQSLHVDTTNRKLLDKIRKMKAKYEKNVKKSEIKSDDEQFRSLHEVKVYDLSKKIWGAKEANNGGGGIDQRSARGGMKETPMKKGEQNAGPSQMLVSDDLLNEKSFMKDGLNLIDIATRSELEQNWKKLKIDEAELYLRRIDLAHKQTKLVLDAFKRQ